MLALLDSPPPMKIDDPRLLTVVLVVGVNGSGKTTSIAKLAKMHKDRGDRESYVQNCEYLDPDLVFFAGDQSYDHTEHTASWLLFGSQFGEIWRERPCISIPDDHDIGQGNLWGEGGIFTTRRSS